MGGNPEGPWFIFPGLINIFDNPVASVTQQLTSDIFEPGSEMFWM